MAHRADAANARHQRRHFGKRAGDKLSEGLLNRVEAVIRTFDPCLRCFTHADGRLGLEVELLNHAGEVLDRCLTP